MPTRIRPPETIKLDISNGDWLIVKKHLTAGEQRRIIKGTVQMMAAGQEPVFDPVAADMGFVLAYLLDWSMTDLEEKQIPIRNQPENVITSALESLPFDDYTEIVNAIQAHDVRMKAERDAEKNARTTVSKSLVTSLSPDSSASGTPTLVISR